MNKNLDGFQSISEENNSLLAIITTLITHYFLLESEFTKLQKENLRISREFEIYRARHPQGVGVKHGKANELKQSEEKNTIDQCLEPPKNKGAQIGHRKQIREKYENYEKTIFINVDCCPGCGLRDLSNIQEVRERYVEDIPPQHPVTTRYMIERRYCRHCKRMIEGEVTDALPHARIGLNTMFIVVWLKVELRLNVSAIPKVLKKYVALQSVKRRLSKSVI